MGLSSLCRVCGSTEKPVRDVTWDCTCEPYQTACMERRRECYCAICRDALERNVPHAHSLPMCGDCSNLRFRFEPPVHGPMDQGKVMFT